MHQIAAFFIGLAASTLGAIGAGGGLISIPGFIFLGLSPFSAIATTRLNVITGGATAVYRYRKNGAVLWKYILPFLVLGLIAGLIGPRLLLGINQVVIQRIIGLFMLIMLPVLWVRKDAGTIDIVRSPSRRLAGFAALFLVLIYSTTIGGGGGILAIYTLVYFFGMTVTEANATSFVVIIFSTSVALVTFINAQAVNWSLGVPSMVGALIGGYLGANLALQNGLAWVKVILTAVIIGSAVELLFFR